jgi:hypothetical protein
LHKNERNKRITADAEREWENEHFTLPLSVFSAAAADYWLFSLAAAAAARLPACLPV